jgi:hypothetical protein
MVARSGDTKKEPLAPSRRAQVARRSTPISVEQSPHSPGLRQLITPPLPNDALRDVPGKVVKIDASNLPTTQEVLKSLPKP